MYSCKMVTVTEVLVKAEALRPLFKQLIDKDPIVHHGLHNLLQLIVQQTTALSRMTTAPKFLRSPQPPLPSPPPPLLPSPPLLLPVLPPPPPPPPLLPSSPHAPSHPPCPLHRVPLTQIDVSSKCFLNALLFVTFVHTPNPVWSHLQKNNDTPVAHALFEYANILRLCLDQPGKYFKNTVKDKFLPLLSLLFPQVSQEEDASDVIEKICSSMHVGNHAMGIGKDEHNNIYFFGYTVLIEQADITMMNENDDNEILINPPFLFLSFNQRLFTLSEIENWLPMYHVKSFIIHVAPEANDAKEESKGHYSGYYRCNDKWLYFSDDNSKVVTHRTSDSTVEYDFQNHATSVMLFRME